MITRAAQFRCAEEFRNEPFADDSVQVAGHDPEKHLAKASRADGRRTPTELEEPDFGPPTKFYDFDGTALPRPRSNMPDILIDGRDFPKGSCRC